MRVTESDLDFNVFLKRVDSRARDSQMIPCMRKDIPDSLMIFSIDYS